MKQDALAAYEAKRLAGTLSGMKMPAHMAQYLSEAEYEVSNKYSDSDPKSNLYLLSLADESKPEFTIRGSHDGRHNGQLSSRVVNSKVSLGRAWAMRIEAPY